MNEYDINNAAVPNDMRHVEPEAFLMSTAGCRVDYILTAGNKLLDAHEIEVIKAGGRFLHFGSHSADNLIGSKTTRGELCSFLLQDPVRIEHSWSYAN